MLRKGSRTVASKQAISVDPSNFPSHFPEKSTRPTWFFSNYPNIFKGFLTNCSHETDQIMSSTSRTDTKPFSAFSDQISILRKIPITNPPPTFSGRKRPNPWDQTDAKGLALIDSLIEDNTGAESSTISKQKRKFFLFDSQLHIQVPVPALPDFPLFSDSNSLNTPAEFGINTPKSNIWPVGDKNREIETEKSSVLTGEIISMEEMEMEEDYTRVISHGPIPRTTHIFGNCVVESCCGGAGSPAAGKVEAFSWENSFSPENFLAFCHHCRAKLGQGMDIFMYRGEKAFCSQECRCQDMLFDGAES
ncbi:hypothetical protein Nepgr_022701 [Nepenthes gracilis]|uniref:FLZ-type domain-containing protein n=1 Tax=Nepenthes gracilis TaxID=150966 RepID=A0AAD3T187_NEPGR|nr:hypothetical protein Nepgr_022701 [Nepenthes gracilis]